jgi:hypothetical protein
MVQLGRYVLQRYELRNRQSFTARRMLLAKPISSILRLEGGLAYSPPMLA